MYDLRDKYSSKYKTLVSHLILIYLLEKKDARRDEFNTSFTWLGNITSNKSHRVSHYDIITCPVYKCSSKNEKSTVNGIDNYDIMPFSLKYWEWWKWHDSLSCEWFYLWIHMYMNEFVQVICIYLFTDILQMGERISKWREPGPGCPCRLSVIYSGCNEVIHYLYPKSVLLSWLLNFLFMKMENQSNTC